MALSKHRIAQAEKLMAEMKDRFKAAVGAEQKRLGLLSFLPTERDLDRLGRIEGEDITFDALYTRLGTDATSVKHFTEACYMGEAKIYLEALSRADDCLVLPFVKDIISNIKSAGYKDLDAGLKELGSNIDHLKAQSFNVLARYGRDPKDSQYRQALQELFLAPARR